MCNKQQSEANASPLIEQHGAFPGEVGAADSGYFPNLASQLFTGRDNALKIAISCRLRYHSAPNAVAFKSEAGSRGGRDDMFPLFSERLHTMGKV